MAKKARKKAKAKTSRKAAKARRAAARRPRKSARAKGTKHTKRSKTRRGKSPAQAGSPFQLMIETINEAERLRAKNERRDVTDETG